MTENLMPLLQKVLDRALLPEDFLSQGIQIGAQAPCFLTGKPYGPGSSASNIAALVESKEAGGRVVAMFGGAAKLECHPTMPKDIRVHIGIQSEHGLALQLLDAAVVACKGKITTSLIRAVVKTYCEHRKIAIPEIHQKASAALGLQIL